MIWLIWGRFYMMMRCMRLAFVHDWLYYMAWAEQVFLEMIHDNLNKYPGNHYKIFTLFSDKTSLTIDGNHISIVTALPRWLFQLFVRSDRTKIPWLSKLFDYRNLMFWYPLLIRILRFKLRLYQYDHLFISSFAVAKNIVSSSWWCTSHTVHLHAQSPFMYIHNHFRSNLSKLVFPIKQLYQIAYRYLKPWDIKPRIYHTITANSYYTAWLMKRIYHIDSDSVVYPRLQSEFLTYPILSPRSDAEYDIFVGRLVCFSKHVDILIQAYNKLEKKLMIIWSWPDEQYLKSLAWPTITFLGRVSDVHTRCELISKARFLVNITLESFGYVTAEALCLWTPVIGFDQWATPELVRPTMGEWVLIAKQDVDTLVTTIKKAWPIHRDRHLISSQARSRFVSTTLTWSVK